MYKKITSVIIDDNGSPLSSIIADIAIVDFEESILNNIDFPIKFFYRYVDGTRSSDSYYTNR